MLRTTFAVALAGGLLALGACARRDLAAGSPRPLSRLRLRECRGQPHPLLRPQRAGRAAAGPDQLGDRRRGRGPLRGIAQLAGQLLEEGDRSPASLFFSQDAGALGELGKAGLLGAHARGDP